MWNPLNPPLPLPPSVFAFFCRYCSVFLSVLFSDKLLVDIYSVFLLYFYIFLVISYNISNVIFDFLSICTHRFPPKFLWFRQKSEISTKNSRFRPKCLNFRWKYSSLTKIFESSTKIFNILTKMFEILIERNVRDFDRNAWNFKPEIFEILNEMFEIWTELFGDFLWNFSYFDGNIQVFARNF